MDSTYLNRKFVEALIIAGAFDSMGYTRQGLLSSFENVIGSITGKKKKEEVGQYDLFSTLDEVTDTDNRVEIPVIDSDPKQMLAMERDTLGFYISDHPLNGVQAMLEKMAEDSIADVLEMNSGFQVTIGGLINDFKKRWTKKNDAMATFQIEDLTGAINCVIFPRDYAKYQDILQDDAIVVLDCRTDSRDETPQVIVRSVKKIDSFESSESLHLSLREGIQPDELAEIKKIIEEHPGNSKLILHVGSTQMVAPMRVSFDDTLVSDLRALHKQYEKERNEG